VNEEELLRGLPREGEPPAGLEERVAGALRAKGLLRPRRRWLPLAAAIALVFAAGFFAGRWKPAPPHSFVLFLHESPRTADESHVAEYVRWSHNDFVLDGHKLANDGGSGIGGFFIIAADSRERALQLAQTCPHLKYGGTIEVREIER